MDGGEPQELTTTARYRAFISYDRSDRAFAKRLQRQLETYVLPLALRSIKPGIRRRARPLKPIFRDEDELVPGEDLPARIRAGLEQSQFLIVVCSPDAAQSPWVEKEVAIFQSLGRAKNVIPVVISGEPNAVAHGHDASLECLPSSLREVEPLWLDWRDARAPRSTLLRLVAALLSLGSFDELVRRDRARRVNQIITRTSIALIVTLAALGAGWRITQLISERANDRAQTIAESARRLLSDDDAEGAARLIVEAHRIDPRIDFDADYLDILNALKRIGPPLAAHGKDTSALYLLSNHRLLLEADREGGLFAWDLTAATSISLIAAHPERILVFHAAASHPDTVLYGGDGGTIGMIDIGASPLRAIVVGKLDQSVLTFASFQGEDYAVGHSGRVSRIHLEGANFRLEPVTELRGSGFLSADITYDGYLVAVSLQRGFGNRAMTIHRWRLGSRNEPSLIPARENSNDISCATVSRSASLIVTGSCDGILQFWDSASGRQIGKPRVGHRGEVELVRLSPNESVAASGGTDSTVRQWLVRVGLMYTGELRPVLRGHTDAIRTIAFSYDGQQLVSASKDGTIRVWDTRGALFELVMFDNSIGEIEEMPAFLPSDLKAQQTAEPVISADQSTRVSLLRTGVLEVADTRTQHREEIAFDTQPFWHLIVSSGGNKVGVRAYGGATRIWTRLGGWGEPVSATSSVAGPIALSDTRPWLALASERGRVSVIDYERNRVLARFTGAPEMGAYHARILSLQFDDAQNRILATTDRGTASWPLPRSATLTGAALASEVCAVVLPGSLGTITANDAEVEPTLSGRVGSDVCDGLRGDVRE
ncbi:MAG: TIR domain-containing protein [Lysobacteraceae bacterium]